jgi:hypothetical protein
METEHLISNKNHELSSSLLFKLSITTSSIIYCLLSIVGLVIGSMFYHYNCDSHLQLLLILESLISIIIIPHLINIIYKEPTHCSLCFFIITFIISLSLIFIGMLLIWPFNEHDNCPIALNQFAFMYFNMWWIVTILAIILFLVLFIVYRKNMK